MVGKAFFLQRLNDHVVYLKKVQRTLDGTEDFQVTDCHDCKLGKWLYGEGVITASWPQCSRIMISSTTSTPLTSSFGMMPMNW